METKTYLQLKFIDSTGNTKIINVPDPRADLTELEVQNAMQDIITANPFETGLSAIDSAAIVTRTVEDVISEV